MAPVEDVKLPSPQKNKSSVLKNFVHRRQASRGEALVPEPLHATIEQSPDIMGVGVFTKNNPGALGELQKNQQEPAPRLYRQSRDEYQNSQSRGRSLSPTKGVLSSNPFSRGSKSRESSPTKPKSSRTGTNFVGLLSRPKSLKSLYKLATEQEESQKEKEKDKENQTPQDESLDLAPPPPIFAQFTSDTSVRKEFQRQSAESNRHSVIVDFDSNPRPAVKPRPKSFQVPPMGYRPPSVSSATGSTFSNDGSRKGSGSELSNSKSQRSRALKVLSGRGHSRSKSTVASSPVITEPNEPVIDPKDIDKHLEAMLDRRNIPENQRYKMRNLNSTIKMEFIRQDWAEMQAAKGDRPSTTDSVNSTDGVTAVDAGDDSEAEKQKRTRGRSFTFSRGRKESKESASTTKKSKGEGTLGRHFRSKSTDSVVSEKAASITSVSTSTSILSKIKFQQGPGDYVSYMRKVQKPELVEVGKIHKLRLLLRNETVAWIEDFIQQGGMKEIVDLLNRIMDVEWREEHEDALLHENLLCLKALSTTAKAMQYIHSIHTELFPKLLHLLFDPDKKGPSEFTTRNIVTSILFTYIESSSPTERLIRAKSVLAHLRDPAPKDDKRPLDFVLEMRQDRPFTVWNKEVVSVTKEVFWIFLHNLNVVTLPSDKRGSSPYDSDSSSLSSPAMTNEHYSYMMRHFPQERPPVPAAPYVGGVEWDATNYLASHLDLMNGILACTPTARARNALRGEMRISGWERCMGGSLRLCKEKFYGSVHDGLRTWVAAAAEDGWETKDVRYGPPVEVKSPPKKPGGGQKMKVEPAPKIEIPKLDFGLPPAATAAATSKVDDDGWI